jgi:hypothetical protein
MVWILFHTLPNKQLFIESSWIICHKQRRRARDYGLQLRAKAANSIIGSAEYVMGGGGSGRHHGLGGINSVILSSCIVML